ncbi:MAG: PspC domain-containing protein [Paucibacter sp.]|nr:PspC domain-containing protein [Roseateles sp.]
MSNADELSKLADLHQRGVLSDEEFAQAKARVLGGIGGGTYGDPGAAGPAASELHNLRRSRSDAWVGGVCGGVARFTGVPAWVWRLLFIALVLCAGSGFLLYLLLWIFVPAE